MNEWWRATTRPGPWETIVGLPLGEPSRVYGREDVDGVPLGMSRDYDFLPRVTALRHVQCMTCWQTYADAARRQPDGVECRTLRCKLCREEAREAWIAENRAELPRAVARYRP